MEIKEAIQKLEDSSEFKIWREENKEDYLSYMFTQSEEGEEWQIGYYNKEEDRVTTFILNDKVQIVPHQEIFKKPESDIKKLEIEKAKLTFREIIEKALKFQKDKYPNEIVNQKIIILQNLKEYGTVWNITLITKAFNMLNMKINASDGEPMHYNLSSILNLRKEGE